MKRGSLRYKFLALGIALVIWVYANGGLSPTISKELPVNVQYISTPPIGSRFGAPWFSPGKVRVSGTARDVNAVSRLVIAVDPGENVKNSIDGSFPVIPQGKDGKQVQDVDLSPEKVRLRVVLRKAPARRAVLVSLDIVGQPAPSYKVASVEVIPNTVMILGRPDDLVGISTLRTEPLDINNRTRTFSQDVKVIAPEKTAFADVSAVRVTVKIEQQARPVSTPAPKKVLETSIP